MVLTWVSSLPPLVSESYFVFTLVKDTGNHIIVEALIILGQTKSDTINCTIEISNDFYLVISSKLKQ